MKIMGQAAALIRSLSGVFNFGTIGDGQALKREGLSIVGGDLTAAEVGAIPDAHTDDEQIAYYSGGWAALDVGAAGKTAMQAGTAEQLRAASASTKTWQKTAAPTVNNDSSAGYVAGDLWNDTTNNLTYVADSVAVGAADWRSLLTANGFRWYISGGSVWFVATHTKSNGTTVDLSSPLQATSTSDPSAFGCTLSGSSVVVPNGAVGVSGSIPTRGQYWGAALSSLGLSFPTAQHNTTYRTNWGALTGTRGGAQVSICMLTSVTTFGGIQRGVGVNLSTTGLNFNPCWYSSGAGGLFANVGGASNSNGVTSTVVQLTSVAQANDIQRYNAGVYASNYAGSDGNATTTQFDRAALWIGIGTGVIVPGFSLDGLNGTVRWSATT